MALLNDIFFWTLIGENFFVLVGVGVWAVYRFIFRLDAGVYVEKRNGAVIYKSTRAKSFLDGGLPYIKLFFMQHRETPAPSNDAVMPGNKGTRIELWLDPENNLHQVRKAKFVPVITNSKTGLRQVVKEVELADGSKKFVGVREVLFEPDSKSDRAWAWSALRRKYDKHKIGSFEQYKPIIVIGAVAVVSIAALVFSGYYLAQMHEKLASACNAQAAQAIADKFGSIFNAIGVKAS